MLGSRSEPMQSNITACSTGQSANHLHHRGDEVRGHNMKCHRAGHNNEKCVRRRIKMELWGNIETKECQKEKLILIQHSVYIYRI